MSKYTTEVRYICEEYAGLDESVGYDDIDKVVDLAVPKVFDVDNIPVYVEEHKPLLFKKILLHYYQREIGFETVGLWKYYLNTKLKEIMPYYNKLYESELLEYNPLQNVDNTHTHEGDYADTSKVDNVRAFDSTSKTENTEVTDNNEKINTESDTNNTKIGNRNLTQNENANSETANSYNRDEDVLLKHTKKTSHGDDTTTREQLENADNWTLYSDTPQGGIDGLTREPIGSGNVGLDGNNYLTSATHVIDSKGKNKDTNTFGDINESYNVGNSTPDHTDISGSEVGNDVLKRNVGENEEKSDTEQGNRVDDTLAHKDGTTLSSGTKNDGSTTVDNNLKSDAGNDKYTNKEYGKIGVMTYQEMVMKYRETFLNIDMMIIDELKDLFMKVW